MRMPTLAEAIEALEEFIEPAVELRKEIHASPMVGGEEEVVARKLSALLGRSDAPSVSDGRVLRFGRQVGPAIAIRAELDALPVIELTGVPWASKNGKMHACGHDVHQAALVAVVQTLERLDVPIGLVAVFQPREETLPSGAPDILASAEWKSHDIAAMVAAHIQPQLPGGSVSAPAGAINAAADEFYIDITGRGGHAAYPHTLQDPIVAAAGIVAALQQVVSRLSNPMEPAVLSVGSINGGSAANVVPDEVKLQGTLRTYSAEQRRGLAQHLVSIAENIAAGYGCTVSARVSLGEPVLVNNPSLAEAAHANYTRLGFEDTVEMRSCGADDFSYYSSELPTLMTFVGTGPGPESNVRLHDAQFLPGDESVRHVAQVLLASFFAAADVTLSAETSTTTTGVLS